MEIGDLIKHKDHEQYGIILEIVEFNQHQFCSYYVVLWQCGNRSGQYGGELEVL